MTQLDAASRQETARLSALSTQAGFTAPASDALARARAANARGRATRHAAQCELDLKALVALTGLDEPDLRQKLAPAHMQYAQTAIISIANVPAEALTQRPDVFSAGREVAAASANLGSTQAARYPRLALSGSLGVARIQAGGSGINLDTWSIGPLTHLCHMALARLLGFDLCPRLKELKQRHLFVPRGAKMPGDPRKPSPSHRWSNTSPTASCARCWCFSPSAILPSPTCRPRRRCSAST